MATLRWIGRDRQIARVLTANISAYDATTTYKLTAGSGRVVSQIGIGGNIATTAANFALALANVADPEFTEYTWTSSTSFVIGTQSSTLAGKSSTFTSSVTGGAGTIAAVANTTAPQSPSDVSTALNYDTGSLPVAADTLVFDSGAAFSLLWNANALTAVLLDTLNVQSAYTGGGGLNAAGWIGLPSIDQDGTAYAQWRPQYFNIGANSVNVGDFSGGQGPSLFKLDTNAATAANINVFSTGTSSDTNTPAFVWKGNAVTMRIEGGSTGAAIYGNETALVTSLIMNAGSFLGGTGLTLTTANQVGGSMDTSNTITTKNQNGGSHVHRAGGITTLTLNSGVFSLVAAQDLTIGTMTIGAGGVLDCSLCTAAITLTNVPTVRPGATIIDPMNRLQAGGTLSLVAQGGLNSINLLRAPANGTVTVN